MYPRSGFRSGRTSESTLVPVFRSRGTSERTLVPVFVPGEHPPKPPFWKPPFWVPPILQGRLTCNVPLTDLRNAFLSPEIMLCQ